MKKLFVFLIAVMIAGALQGQNTFKYRINVQGGMNMTKKNLAAHNVDSMRVVAGALHVYQGATDLDLGSGTGKVNLADSVNYPSGYMTRMDGVVGLGLKVNLSDSVNYLNGYMTRMDGVAGLALKVDIADSTAGTGHYASNYDLTTGLGAKVDTAGQVEITDVAVMLADMKSTLAFGVGSGDAADTTSLSTTRKYGSLYWGGNLTFHADTMIVSLMAGAGLDTIAVQINWSDTLNAVIPTVINTTALAVGRISGTNVARTIGQFDYSFNNATIPPGKHVWMSLPYIPAASLKRKPTMVSVTLIGHLQ